jgi:sugar/nucleoside kinase (ribokinase family)
MTRVFIVGDLAVDIVTDLPRRVVIGGYTILPTPRIVAAGVAGNMAWYLKQLGIEPTVVATIGDDSWGILLKDQLVQAGISTELIKISKILTGFFLLLVDKKGERTMIGSRGANTNLSATAEEIVNVHPQWIHVSGYSLLNQNHERVMKTVRRASEDLAVPISTDLEGISVEGGHVDLEGVTVFCNDEEFRAYFRTSPRKVARTTRQTIIVKAGPKGCYLISRKRLTHFPSVTKAVVDTTAAGDAFNSGYIASILSGRDEIAACRFANAVAAVKIRQMGAKAAPLSNEFTKLMVQLIRK